MPRPNALYQDIDIDHYMDLYGVARSTIYEWLREGKNVKDEVAIRRYLATRHNTRSVEGEGAQELRERKLAAEAELREVQAARETLKLEVDRGNLIGVADVAEAQTRIAAVVKAQLQRLEGDLPPMLEGCNAVQIQTILRDKIAEVLKTLSEEQTWSANE
jgi:phage terminase Nu1 subunit (DNA packaging protein)